MHKKSVSALLLVFLLLSFSGCMAPNTRFSDIAERFSVLLEELPETISVRALEKQNAQLREPDYVDWQTSRLYYAALTEKEQLAYRCIYNNIFGQPERIAVPMLENGELNNVFTALQYDNTQLLFLSDTASLLTAGISCYFVPSYTLSYWTAREQITLCAQNARAWLQGLPEDVSQYEKLLFAHDILCEQTVYEQTDFASQANGVLLEQKATCAGYSKALKWMLDILGIENCLVTGSADGGDGAVSHMWLAVNTDGAWSFCDPTWDDPVAEDGRQVVEHSYFSLSQTRLSLTHSNIEMPAGVVCDREDTDYFMRKGLYCIPETYRRVIAGGLQEGLQSGAEFVTFRFDTVQSLQEACEELLENGDIYRILDDLQDTGRHLQTDRIGYAADEERLQLKLIFSFE